ncbi:uncharacterized protein LOC144014724 isoform X2 [Festucalex cinctus]
MVLSSTPPEVCTRRKLEKRWTKGKKLCQQDRTKPREEEEVTCVYRTPVRSDLPENKRSTRSARLSARPKKSSQDVPKKARSSRFIPVWAQLVFFLIAAVFLYLVISNISNICWGVMINIDDYS